MGACQENASLRALRWCVGRATICGNMNLLRSLRQRRSLLAVFVVFLFFYAVAMLCGLGLFGFVGPDEPRYSAIAREMFLSGDYVSTRLAGLLWFEKPVLFYWLAAVCYAVFGVGEFAARLPSATVCLLSVVVVFGTLRRAGFERWALISAVVLATSAMWMSFGYAATTDMVLASTLCAAMMAGFLASIAEGKTRLIFLTLCAVATALAMLAKGLVGVFFVIAILGIYSVVSRRFVLRSWKDVTLAAVAFILVASLWYVPVLLRHGNVFFDEFFVNQHFKRFLTDKYRHSQPAYFYIFIAFVGAIPWSLFLWPAAMRLRSLRPRQNERDALITLAWIWFLLPLAFFSASTSKLPSYILPVFPALAILLGAEIERLWHLGKSEKATTLRNIALGNALLFCVLGVAGVVLRNKPFFAGFSGIATTLFAVLSVGGAAAIVALVRGHLRCAIFFPAAAVLSIMTAAIFVLPALSHRFSLREYSKSVTMQLQPGEKTAMYRIIKQYAHVFYSDGRFVYYQNGVPVRGLSTGDDVSLDKRQDLMRALRFERGNGGDSLVVFTDKIWRKELESDADFSAQLIAQHRKDIAMRIRLKPRD